MSRLGTETAFEVLARARVLESQGRDIIHLEIGEPDFDTPADVINAGARAMTGGATHYSPAGGIPELRAAIAEDAGRRRGLSMTASQIVVTPGAKPIMFFVMLALLEEGDSVAYPDPGFPIYESMVDFLGARRIPIGYRVKGGRFFFNVDDLIAKVDASTRLIILNSPSNPTGATLSHDDVSRIAQAARRVDAIVLSDEIYMRILYEGKHESIAAIPGMAGRTVILDGFSKTYAMTGWRLGYGIMPEELATAVTGLMINSNSCTAAFTQIAGVEALNGSQTAAENMVEEFRRRRGLIVQGLNAIDGVSCAMPAGAFYAFPDIRGTGLSSRKAANLLLEEGGVAVLSGTAFGANGEGYLRLSYANSYENIQRALERIEEVFASARAVTAGGR
jgi:aspartate/methionine/tyrosine aminotransferase